MSSYYRNYLVYGIKYDYKEFKELVCDDDGDLYDLIEHLLVNNMKEVPNNSPLSVIYDGMCGEYVIVGVVLSYSNKNCIFESVTEIREPDSNVKNLLKFAISKEFPTLPTSEIGLILVTHCQ